MRRARPDRPGVDDPGRGRRLGVDVGSVRVGVAVSDPDAMLATPVETVARSPRHTGPDTPDLARVQALAREHEVVEVVVGLPQTLRGEHGHAAALTATYARYLRRALDPVPVRLADERLSTVAASRTLSEMGVRGQRQRAVVDQAAAVHILQSWLDARLSILAAAEPVEITR